MGHKRKPKQDFRLTLKLLQAQYKERFQHALNLKSANVILMVLASGATLFLGFDFWLGMPRVSAVERLENMARSVEIGDLGIARLEPLSVYTREITSQNIFALAASPESDISAGRVPEKPKADLEAVTAGLKVVGIIWSDTPQVIIEDEKEARTYLLNRAGKVRGARIKEILKDRVILSYDDQEIELK